MQLKIIKGWKEISSCSCNKNVIKKYRSFYDFNLVF